MSRSEFHMWGALITFVMVVAISYSFRTKDVPKPVLITPEVSQIDELGNYTLLQMKIVNSQMSDVRKQVTAKQIANVAMDILETQEQRKQFITLLAIESKFDSRAKSHVGAVGLGQIMPAYAKEFAAKCGIKEVSTEDLFIPEINLTIAACRFRQLLGIFPGQISLVLISYNAGQNSNQIKQLQDLKNLSSMETSGYLNKFMYLNDTTKLVTADK